MSALYVIFSLGGHKYQSFAFFTALAFFLSASLYFIYVAISTLYIYVKHKKLFHFNSVALLIFICVVALFVLVVVGLGIGRNFIFLLPFIFLLYAPLYFIYVVISTLYILVKHKKLFHLDAVVFLMFICIITLYLTGFCFSQMRYWSKGELIDKMLQGYANGNCYAEYKIKNNIQDKHLLGDDYTMATKECSAKFESIKAEAPQCFTSSRPDVCKGVVTHFDKKTQSVIKSKIEVYRWYGDNSGSIGNLPFKRIEISSGLNVDPDNMNVDLISSCGDIKCYSCWD